MKIVIGIAVMAGLIIGIGIAVVQNNGDSGIGSVASADSTSEKFDPKDLPVEVLKALPDEQMAELFPEKAEAILIPGFAEQTAGLTKAGGNTSDDPEYLRAVLQKMGADPPADATTKELQDMLAHVGE